MADVIEEHPQATNTAAQAQGLAFMRDRLPPHPDQLPESGKAPTINSLVCCRKEVCSCLVFPACIGIYISFPYLHVALCVVHLPHSTPAMFLELLIPMGVTNFIMLDFRVLVAFGVRFHEIVGLCSCGLSVANQNLCRRI